MARYRSKEKPRHVSSAEISPLVRERNHIQAKADAKPTTEPAVTIHAAIIQEFMRNSDTPLVRVVPFAAECKTNYAV